MSFACTDWTHDTPLWVALYHCVAKYSEVVHFLWLYIASSVSFQFQCIPFDDQICRLEDHLQGYSLADIAILSNIISDIVGYHTSKVTDGS